MTKAKQTILTSIICLLIGGTLGYLATATLQPKQVGPTRLREQPGNLPGPRNGQALSEDATSGSRPNNRVAGKITSTSNGHLTIQTPNNNSQIIIVSSGTTYQQITAAQGSNMTEGKQIMITGQTNPDGSLTAESIQLLPEEFEIPFRPNQ